jgi:peptide deformylase
LAFSFRQSGIKHQQFGQTTMPVKKIVLYSENEDALRKISKPAQKFDEHLKQLIKDLIDTLNESTDGIGLAAPQISVHKQVVLVRLKADAKETSSRGNSLVLVNPIIKTTADERRDFDGCLSFPGLYAQTTRPHYLLVTALNENGKNFEREFSGFDAVVVHHEIDHLKGILFIDRVENIQDFYRVRENERGELIRVPII